MIKLLKRVNDGIAKCEITVMATALICMAIFGFAQVLSRFVFKNSLPWVEEVTKYLMVWVTYLGLGYCAKTHGHIEIDLVPQLVKKYLKVDISAFIDLIVFGFTLVFLSCSWTFVMDTMAHGQTTPVLLLPMWTIYSVFLIGNGLCIFHMIANFILRFLGKEEGRDE